MRTRFYYDETKDDFQNTKTSLNVTVNGDYDYLPKNPFFRLFAFWLYYFVAVPLLTLANFFVFGTRVHGRKNLKSLRGKGYFLYANHTHYSDVWLGPVLAAPFRRSFVVANKDAIQIPYVRVLTKALGALPVADTVSGMKNMTKAIAHLIEKGKIVAIFPEAHIWHYYTGLRPFPLTSFKFPASNGAPVVPVAVCYKKRWLFGNKRKPRAHVYLGLPIYPKAHFTDKQNAEYLRNSVQEYIKLTLHKNSTYAYYNYIKIEKEQEEQQRAIV